MYVMGTLFDVDSHMYHLEFHPNYISLNLKRYMLYSDVKLYKLSDLIARNTEVYEKVPRPPL